MTTPLQPHEPVRFPDDESRHDCIVEWWYFNGHLQSADGREYSFMNCLFRVDVKRVKIPFISKLPLRTLHFSHSLVSDLAESRFHHHVNPVAFVSDDSFMRRELFVNYLSPSVRTGYVNCAIEQTGTAYRVKNEDLDLTLTAAKPPLLGGGTGYVELHSKASYYYSLTNLKAEGWLKVGDGWVAVTGKSWMDHQWADTSYSKDRWDWFSIQLEDDTELVCYVYDDGQVQTRLADISYPDGRCEHLENVDIIPGDRKWQSPQSKAAYPLTWRISIPTKGVDLTLTARIEGQEMVFGTINYWEGPLAVEGSFAGRPARGVGFMELVGYQAEHGRATHVKKEISRTLKKFVSLVNKRHADSETAE